MCIYLHKFVIKLKIHKNMIYSKNTSCNRCGASIPIIFVTLLIGALGLSFGYLFNTKLFEVFITKYAHIYSNKFQKLSVNT